MRQKAHRYAVFLDFAHWLPHQREALRNCGKKRTATPFFGFRTLAPSSEGAITELRQKAHRYAVFLDFAHWLPLMRELSIRRID